MSGLASESSILIFDRTGRIDLDWGPLSLHLAGRAVFFLWVTLALLAISGIAVLVSRKRELITRWTTWALIVPVVGLPIWSGRGATAALAAVGHLAYLTALLALGIALATRLFARRLAR